MQDASRVVAIDNAGTLHTCSLEQSTSTADARVSRYTVPLALKNIKSFAFQTRPYNQWIEIQNICVDPAHPTQVKVVTSDCPGQR